MKQFIHRIPATLTATSSALSPIARDQAFQRYVKWRGLARGATYFLVLIGAMGIGCLFGRIEDTVGAFYIFLTMGLIWGVITIWPALRYRAYSIRLYGQPLVRFTESKWQRYKRRGFIGAFTALLLLFGFTMGAYPSAHAAPDGLTLAYVFAGFVAVILHYVPPGHEKTSLYRAEHVLIAKEQTQASLRIAGLVTGILSEELHDRLDELQQVKDKIARQQQVANLIESEYTPALASILQTVQSKDEKKRLHQEVLFLLLSFMLGYIANWSSDSILQLLKSLFSGS